MERFEVIAQFGPAAVLIADLICAILGGIIATAILIRLFRVILKKSDHVDDAIVTFVVNAIKVSCIIIIITIVLQILGVRPATIVTVLGAAGAAIALALRDSLANIAGGFMIIWTHPFNKGDLISVGNDRGKVENIDLFLTTLRTLDYRTVTIPNGMINTSVVYNETNQDIRRTDTSFTVAYGSDIEKVKELINNVCLANPSILRDPEPIIGVTDNNENGISLECLVYTRTSEKDTIAYYLRETVKSAFEENEIKMPSSKLDVSLKRY